MIRFRSGSLIGICNKTEYPYLAKNKVTRKRGLEWARRCEV